MKTTVVPAQVTTVEDRIMGSLGLSQLLLLVLPIFIGAGLYVLLPPFMGGAPYKYAIIILIALLCSLLAIRIKGKIVAQWLATIVRYNLRPTYYLFDKNTTANREPYEAHADGLSESTPIPETAPLTARPKLGFHDTARALATLEHTTLQLETTKKGTLHARLTQIEE